MSMAAHRKPTKKGRKLVVLGVFRAEANGAGWYSRSRGSPWWCQPLLHREERAQHPGTAQAAQVQQVSGTPHPARGAQVSGGNELVIDRSLQYLVVTACFHVLVTSLNFRSRGDFFYARLMCSPFHRDCNSSLLNRTSCPAFQKVPWPTYSVSSLLRNFLPSHKNHKRRKPLSFELM